MIDRARQTERCKLDNSAIPNEPNLTESEKADTQEFLNEILSILPLVKMGVFEKAKKIKVEVDKNSGTSTKKNVQDTVIVPAKKEGFEETFLGENCWYAIRISGGRLKDIKYIAAYQTAPISAVTHFAEVESIEPYGDGGKYRLNFAAPAKKIRELKKTKKTKRGILQRPMYTNHDKLLSAKTLTDLFS